MVEALPCPGCFTLLAWVHISLHLSWKMQSGLAPFQGCQGSCGMVPNGSASFFVSFNICQGLKCLHVASTLTLTMWLLCPHLCPQGHNMFSLQQVFRLEHDKESLVLLYTKNLLQKKLIRCWRWGCYTPS